MREIKFKGKTIDNKRWVYGDLKVFEGVYIGYSFETTHFDEGKQLNYMEVEVIPESVSQYTGLKYNKGIDIWEGDIVGFDDGTPIGKITWREFNSQFIMLGKTIEQSMSYTKQNYIVLGNLFEHKHLLT